MSKETVFTVFTPTYNRIESLPSLYQSLCKQTYPFEKFEWLIVDDNSTDGTKKKVLEWQAESPFEIRFINQIPSQSGKHRAFNLGVKNANGRFFTWEDSDDISLPHRLETLYDSWEKISSQKRESFAGVMGLSTDQNGNLLGSGLTKSHIDSDFIEKNYKYGFGKEMSGFIRTSILKNYPFPDIDERYVPEGLIWSAISEEYKFRFINKPVTMMYVSTKSDRLTVDTPPSSIAKGHSAMHRLRLNEHTDYFWYDPLKFFISSVHFNRFSFHRDLYPGQYLRELDNLTMVLLCIFTLPISLLLYLRD